MPSDSAISVPHPCYVIDKGRLICMCTACVRSGYSTAQDPSPFLAACVAWQRGVALNAPRHVSRPIAVQRPNSPASTVSEHNMEDLEQYWPDDSTDSSEYSEASTQNPAQLTDSFEVDISDLTEAEFTAFESLLDMREADWHEPMIQPVDFRPVDVPPTPVLDRSLSPVSMAVASPRGVKRPRAATIMPPPAPILVRMETLPRRHRPVHPGQSRGQAVDLTNDVIDLSMDE